MRIIDADGHVAEGASLAVEAMQRWPEYITPRTDVPGLVIEGRNYPESSGPGAGCPTEHGLSAAEGINCRSAEGVLGDADRDQIDTMVLYPSLGLCTPTLEDPEFAAGFARLYNEWIADYCKPSNGRLHGIAVTPIEHGDVAIDIMREAKDLGLGRDPHPARAEDPQPRSPRPRPVLRGRRRAGNAARHPRRARRPPPEDRCRPVHELHSGALHQLPVRPDDGDDGTRLGRCLRPAPGLRVAFLEAGVGWVPFFIDRLHEHFEKRGDWIEGGWQRDPQEYLTAGNIWATCEPEEPILPGVIDVLGDDFIMFASDYPHWDGEWPESTKHLRNRPDISEETRAKIGGLNALRFYGLN